jgi:hypothetical protein
VERTVRRPTEGVDKKLFSSLEAIEFVFSKEYSKMLRPIFTQDYDYDVKEENGTITFILTPKSSNQTSKKQAIENDQVK